MGRKKVMAITSSDVVKKANSLLRASTGLAVIELIGECHYVSLIRTLTHLLFHFGS
jgi:hypothetical protein